MAGTIDDWTRRTGRAARMALLGLAVVSLAACVERLRSHGYVPEEADLQMVTVGVDTRDTVSELLGAPSTSGVVNDSGYYYVRSTFRHIGPTAPKVVEREIVAVTFDADGVVTNIQRYGLEDGRPVVLSRRVTDNDDGQSLIAQLIGNIGSIGPNILGQ